MSHSNNIKDELNEFAPDLSRMDKQEGFQVPPRYFDRLGDEVIRKIANGGQAEKKRPWSAPLFDFLQSLVQPRLAIGLVAVALLFIGVRQFIPNQINEASEGIALESLTDEEFASYIADNIYEFEDELLFDLVKEEPYLPESIEDEDLNSYFKEIREDIDFSNLEELL